MIFCIDSTMMIETVLIALAIDQLSVGTRYSTKPFTSHLTIKPFKQ